MSMRILPQDMILEILKKFPIKSLIRFRCVCKLWDSVLSDSQFSKQLYQRDMLLYVYHHTLNFHYKIIDLNKALLMLANINDIDNVVELPWGNYGTRTWGSCDGLLVSQRNKILYLWNPARIGFVTLPPGSCCFGYFRNNAGFGPTVVHYGFGYDESIDDYKVVKVAYLEFGRTDVEVLTLKTGEWRRKALDTNFRIFDSAARTYGIFSNNALHWIAYCIGNPKKKCLIAFDLSKEEFQFLPPPDCCDCYDSVDALRGCIFLLCTKCPRFIHSWCHHEIHDVWMMEE